MRKFSLILILTALAAFAIVYYLASSKMESPGGTTATNILKKEKPYDKYTFERLAVREPKASAIEIGRILAEEEGYRSYIFYYKSEGRRISGMLNMPFDSAQGLRPVVVMARGYVDKEEYKTGMGTKNAAAYYAGKGYLTLAPDFSGYGESDQEDENPLGARLTKPVEIIDLLASLESLPQAETEQVYLWGHSNGGQIMLSVAEILGKQKQLGIDNFKFAVRGVTLWAPVSKPFPYSILYYTDEADDKGKFLRAEIAKFEQDYDVFNFSIDRYLDWTFLPIQIHQGTADESVPKKWSDELVTILEEKEKEVRYYLYPGADHNLRGGWNTVVARDVAWFSTLEKEN